MLVMGNQLAIILFWYAFSELLLVIGKDFLKIVICSA